ncbi:alpha/beta-hydrolase [Thozetella sp. PMI_491]|nr:alpha/beta-hydrolase [Thozetella sp. PMI_491]
MKLAISTALGLASLASASVVPRQGSVGDTANDWDGILAGASGAKCADLAVIFARGTFDSGNIGPWVGPGFRDALRARFGSVAVQGVSPDDYSADLAGYIEDGGTVSCAYSIADAVMTYASRCPSAKFVISGWSQGALCAHKSFDTSYGLYDSAVRSRVIALTTFGDPMDVWQDSETLPALPSNTKFLTYCQSTVPDPLCRNPLEDFPSSASGLIDWLVDMWETVDETHMNDDQRAAVADLLVELPKQAAGELGHLARDIFNGDIRRWLLTPEHFWYGIDGTVVTAAADIASVFKA